MVIFNISLISMMGYEIHMKDRSLPIIIDKNKQINCKHEDSANRISLLILAVVL